MTIVYRHRVRYHEADAQGFLFNGRYLEIADVALTEYFRHHGWPYPTLVAKGMDPSVVSARLQFAKPAYFDDVIEVDTRCTRVGNSSFALSFVLERSSPQVGPVATIEMVYVNVDPSSARSRVIPSHIADTLRTDMLTTDIEPSPPEAP